jgi:hypothetical protein
MRRLTPALLTAACLLLAGCSNLSSHGPVDARTLRRLDQRAITRKAFEEKLKSPTLLPTLLPAVNRITLPFRMVSGTPVIDAVINHGNTIEMMVDTGAARMMIHARTAEKHQIAVVRSDEAQVTMVGVTGAEQGRLGFVSPLHLGNWVMQGYPCFVRTHESRLLGAQLPANILGFDLPARVCSYLTFDYKKHSVTFGFRDPFVPDARLKSSTCPFRISQGVPFIQVKAKGKSWTSLVDTGSFNGIEINEELAQKLGVQDQGRPVEGLFLAGVGGTISSEKAKLRTLTFDEISLAGGSYPKAEVDVSPGLPRVGSFFLKDYRVTFDFRRKRLWLEW